MGHTIAFSNQKGGVGKTTSAVSIAAELGLMGRRVLLIDFDPQGSATSGLGVEFREEGHDIYDVFFQRLPLSAIIKPSKVPSLFVAPSSKDLISIEVELGKSPGRELILKSELKLLQTSYDYILIDCPPSSGLLTLNALGAADSLLIPLQAEYYALEGITALMTTLEFVKQTFNPELSVLGVFITMFDNRTNLSIQVDNEAREFFKEKMFKEKIPRNIRIAESPSHGMPICMYAPGTAGAKAYHNLALEIDERCFGKVGEQLVANA